MEVKFLRLAHQVPLHSAEGVFVKASEFRGEVGHLLSREGYIQLVHSAVTAMREGAFQKVALSRVIPFESNGITPSQAAAQLSRRFPHLTVFHFADDEGNEWVGATPELLFSKEGNHYRTISLAGTRLAIEGGEPWGEKEIQEQLFVTEYICETISALGGRVERVGDAETFRSGSIEHLRSEIFFSYSGDWKDVLEKLHPTSAVAGMPVQQAFPFIQAKEPHDREYYTGVIGVEKGDEVEVYVLLRLAKYKQGYYYAFVGAGITKDSVPTHEADEVENKAKSFMSPIFELSS